MNGLLFGYYTALGVLRLALFGFAVIVAVVCAVDWAVRTRRINPFSPVARFFRRAVDPALAPVERRVVRAGGLPSSAPWWALATVVGGGIILVSILGWLGGQISFVSNALQAGAAGVYRLLVSWTFAILQLALIVRVISSWLRVSPYSPWVRWSFALTEPLLRPLRQLIPPLGMIDITPIVAYFALSLLARLFLSIV